MENKLVESKSWDLKGEVMSGDRPENSLLGMAVAIERYFLYLSISFISFFISLFLDILFILLLLSRI